MQQAQLIFARRLWDGSSRHYLHDAAVLMEERRIARVGRRREFPQHSPCPTHDLGDVVLLPGLIDSHVHMADDGWTPLLMLACGITSVRDTGNHAIALIELRRRQREGSWLGPRIVTYGPLIDAKPTHWPHVALGLGREDDADAAIDKLCEMGVDGLKTYVRADPHLVERVVRRAHRHGRRVTCHCGACSAGEALDRGMDCVEHVFCLEADLLEHGQEWDTLSLDSPRVTHLIERFARARATFVPTLAVAQASQHLWGPRFDRYAGYHEYPEQFRRWLKQVLALSQAADRWDSLKVARAGRAFRRMGALTKLLFNAGVPMLAGSDTPFVPVGRGFIYELELLQAAGLPPREILLMATTRAAHYLNLGDQVGAIAPGLSADLVAVSGDPLNDVRALREIKMVWQSGVQLDPDALRCQAHLAIDKLPDDFVANPPPWGIAQ